MKANNWFTDNAHTTEAGSKFYADMVVAGIKCLGLEYLIDSLSPAKENLSNQVVERVSG